MTRLSALTAALLLIALVVLVHRSGRTRDWAWRDAMEVDGV